jgi:tripartite-type tricarboxylate transporter receptor subunit TctC
MTRDFGAAVIVENVTGAGGALAAVMEAKAPLDGYTLLFGDTEGTTSRTACAG